MSSPKLFNPGPVDVSQETFAAMSRTMIGHRGAEFEALYASLQPGLQEIFGTKRPVFTSTSSAWGVMEGALRNLVREKVLCLCCGAFSDKWFDVAKKMGYAADKIQVEWGETFDPEVVRAKLAEGGFDTVTFIHSETSTGVLNDIAAISKVVKSFPDTILIVDTVSSLSTVPVDMDANEIDVMLAGVQKALALPPGLAVFAILLCLPLAVVIRLVAGPLAERRYDEQELQGQIYSLAEQTLSAIPIVQAFGREQHEDERFRHLARRTTGANLRYEIAGHKFKAATGAISAVATACVMIVGGFAVRDGRLSLGSLLVLMSYFVALYSPLETLAYLAEGFSTAKDGAIGTRMPALDATIAEIVIARARPIRSATAAQGSTEMARAPVATETASDTVDSVSPHSAAIEGSTACTA